MPNEFLEYIGRIHFKNYVTLPTGIIHVLDEYDEYNLITNAGRTFLVSRLGSNANNFITHMAVGTGANAAALGDTTLQTETVRLACTNATSGTPNWGITFSATYTSTQINNTTEVGLLNASSGGTLVTRAKYTAISVPAGSSMAIDYTVALLTLSIITGWTLTAAQTNTYQIAMASGIAVRGVIESDTNNGYAKKTSIATVEATASTYWHDTANNLLYIHCSAGGNPSAHTIMVQSGG
jgi:hypothetical protein